MIRAKLQVLFYLCQLLGSCAAGSHLPLNAGHAWPASPGEIHLPWQSDRLSITEYDLDSNYRYLVTEDGPLGWQAKSTHLELSYNGVSWRLPAKDEMGWPPIVSDDSIIYISYSEDSVVVFDKRSAQSVIYAAPHHPRRLYGQNPTFVLAREEEIEASTAWLYYVYLLTLENGLQPIGSISSDRILADRSVLASDGNLYIANGHEIYRCSADGIQLLLSLTEIGQVPAFRNTYLVPNSDPNPDSLLVRHIDTLYVVKDLTGNPRVANIIPDVPLAGSHYALQADELAVLTDDQIRVWNTETCLSREVRTTAARYAIGIFFVGNDGDDVGLITENGTIVICRYELEDSIFPIFDADIEVIGWRGEATGIAFFTSDDRLAIITESRND